MTAKLVVVTRSMRTAAFLAAFDAAPSTAELRERIAEALRTASATQLTRYETVPYANAVLAVLGLELSDV